MDNRNFTLLTDFYEITMMQGYFKNHASNCVVFDLFYFRIRMMVRMPYVPDWLR